MTVNAEIQKMQKKVGRPSKGGPGTLMQMRVSDEYLAKIDDWRRHQEDLPVRTEAIRRLTELGLAAEKKRRP